MVCTESRDWGLPLLLSALASRQTDHVVNLLAEVYKNFT